MPRSAHTALYDAFRKELVAMRRRAGLTQRGLAERLGRERSMVARIELGERRLDVVEFYWFCRILGESPGRSASRVMGVLDRADPLTRNDYAIPARSSLFRAADRERPG